jgi:hypothetical protein
MFEGILEKVAGAVSVGAEAVSRGAEAVSKGATAVKKAQEDAWTVSEDSPFIASNLEIYPQKIQYKDIACSYDDIEHLGWHWKSKTVNGLINTQAVDLTIYIKNNKNISIEKTTMYVTPKLVHAYNYIAKKTFDRRLQYYTNQLDEKGSFDYSGAIIHSDGTVKSGNKTYELSKADIYAFEITIKEGGMFSSKLTIDLSVDKDIVLALIHHIIKNPHKAEIKMNNINELYKHMKNN